MGILEEINEYLDSLWETIKKHFVKIFSLSIPAWLALPSIKWGFYGLLYFIRKTPEALDKFAQVTFVNSFLPWWLGVITDPLKAIATFILLFILIGIVINLFDGD